jgi:hypothetical protein
MNTTLPLPPGHAGGPPRGTATPRLMCQYGSIARVLQNLMPQELNWAGQPIGEGEGYGGRKEWIPATWDQNPAAKHHYCVVTESHLAEVFGNGLYKLSRPKAAERLEELTGAHRTSCYRALRLNGRFARHLHGDGAMLSWR